MVPTTWTSTRCGGPQRKGAFRRPTDLACTTHNFIARHIIETPQLHVTLSDRALLPPLAIVRAPIWRLRTRATVAKLSERFEVGTVCMAKLHAILSVATRESASLLAAPCFGYDECI